MIRIISMKRTINLYLVIAVVVLTIKADVPETVKELDLSKYSGTWYQVFFNSVVAQSQQTNQMCVVEKYTYVNSTTFSSSQFSRLSSPFGAEMRTKAQIIRPDAQVPGTFQMMVDGAPHPTPYLVIKLGPVHNKTGLYEYAVVTDSNAVLLFIYSRNIFKFRRKYQDDVIDFCHDVGFSSYYNEPIKSPQPAACKYYNDNDDVTDFFEGDEEDVPQVIQ